MIRSKNQTRRLWMESLETRTLLAGGSDPFALLTDFNLAKTALSGNGDYTANFSPNFGNQQLVLVGSGQNDLTIDLNKLPDFITNLRITGFGDVTFTGTDHLQTLVLDHVDNVFAPNLSVTGALHANDVNSLTLATAATTTVLKGDKLTLNVANLDDTTIYSDLDVLTLGSQSRSIYIVSVNSHQDVRLTYTPDVVTVTGLPDATLHVFLPGQNPTTTVPPEVTNPPNLTGGGSTGVGTGGTSSIDPVTNPDPNPVDTTLDPVVTTPVVIISVPADERTQAFIAELRELLHSNNPDTHQAVLDFMAHAAPIGGVNALSLPKILASNSTSLVARPATVRFEADGELIELQGMFEHTVPVSSDLLGTPNVALSVQHGPDGEIYLDHPIKLHSTEVTTPLNTGPAIDVSFAWPIAATSPAPAVAAPHVRPVNLKAENEPIGSETAAAVAAFGNYIVERVSAEFSPGHQSVVLLVDPKPSRVSGSASQSAIDSFARGGASSQLNRKIVG